MGTFGLSEDILQNIESAFHRNPALAGRPVVLPISPSDAVENDEESVALRFLYAYMPLCDLADCGDDMIRRHVRAVLSHRRTMPWGEGIPGLEFLRYVLPLRVNNEEPTLYQEILHDMVKPAVEGLGMHEAVLEANHWCHGKAAYISTDDRTISPLGMLRAARGRCGEESTFLVSVLRSLCIPARQVYTPLWAHTDDNHAWVEAWVNGEWHYLGACEPEPTLDKGWFTAPSRRSMLVHTRVPGPAYGREEVLSSSPIHTELNLTRRYATVKEAVVRIIGPQGEGTQGAMVSLQIWNSGGFRPLTTILTDTKGEAHFTTGLGDLWIHASKGNTWGCAKLEAGTSLIEVRLSPDPPKASVEIMTIAAPPTIPQGPDTPPSPDHMERLREEDAIRESFISTFPALEDIRGIADGSGLPLDRVHTVVQGARGNHGGILTFLLSQKPEDSLAALWLLESLAVKDLCDITRETLEDFLQVGLEYIDDRPEDIYRAYVLNPRVSTEVLIPHRALFTGALDHAEAAFFRCNPLRLMDWLRERMDIREQPYNPRIPTPAGSFRMGKADSCSFRVLLVALARSLGIPAMLAQQDGKVLLMDLQGSWLETEPRICNGNDSTCRLIISAEDALEYDRDYTLSKFMCGTFEPLALEPGIAGKEIALTPGTYRLICGNRLQDGSVRVQVRTFGLFDGEYRRIPVGHDDSPDDDRKGLGSINPEALARFGFNLPSTDRGGLVLAWIEPGSEPTEHFLQELGQAGSGLDTAGIHVELIRCGITGQPGYGDILKDSPMLSGDSLPVIMAVDPMGTIRYFSSGYRIGTVAGISKALSRRAGDVD